MMGKTVRRTVWTMVLIIAALVILTIVLFTSHSARLFAIAIISETGVLKEKGIRYGLEDRQKLDVYSPEKANEKSPVVIFYYGGAWTRGTRELYHFVGTALAKKGYTTIIPDYRLYPQVRFPEFVEDAALAYSWVWNRHVRKSGKSRPIIVMGHSAGAHIAAMLSYNRFYLDTLDSEIAPPAGFVGLAGPYSFDPTTWPTTREIFASARNADETRPVAFVDRSAPGTLLFHGLDDTTVKLWNARDLKGRLQENSVGNRLIELSGIGHLGVVTAIAQPLRWRAPVLKEILGFLEKYEKGDSKKGNQS